MNKDLIIKLLSSENSEDKKIGVSLVRAEFGDYTATCEFIHSLNLNNPITMNHAGSIWIHSTLWEYAKYGPNEILK